MAKSLLLTVLVDVLGNYVEGLTRENLKLGVWSGNVELSNLQLKASALDQLSLPVRVVRGLLSNLRVEVPWTALDSKPVEVFIDGVYLLAAPLDTSRMSAEEARKMVLSANQAKLKQVEDAIMLAVHAHKQTANSASQKASYVQQLVTRILDNLEVTVSNLHIRYEDSYADKQSTFSCGITLEQLALAATDENWNARFVRRDASPAAAQDARKLGKLQNCTVYWNAISESYADADHDSWMAFMRGVIYREAGPVDGLQFVLLPPNSLQVKITHREQCNENTPTIDMVLESTEIKLNVSKEQYKQAMLLVKSFQELDRKKAVALLRPLHRPSVNPKGWWKYAFHLVLGVDRSFAARMQLMTLCAKARPKYVALVRQKIVNAELHQHDPRAIEDKLKGYDDALPLSTLLVFREIGAKEAALEIQRARQMLKDSEQPSTWTNNLTNFFSGWFQSKEAEEPMVTDEEDSKLMEDLESKLDDLNKQAEEAVNQAFSFRLRCVASASLGLSSEEQVFASLEAAADLQIETRFDTVAIKFTMNQLSVHDCCSEHPYNPDLLAFVEGSEHVPCEMAMVLKPEEVTINISARPALITWNEECVRKLFLFIMAGIIPKDFNLPEDIALRSSLASFATKNALPETTVAISIDLHAPKVIFPELRGSDQCVLVDMGHLTVDGGLSPEGMTWDVRLKDIHVAMPMERPSFSGGFQTFQQYLLNPFEIVVGVQSIHREEAELTVSVQILPFIQADLDAMKIARLIKVMLVVMTSIEDNEQKEIGDQTFSMTSKQQIAVVKGSLPDSKMEQLQKVKLKVQASLPKIVLGLSIEEGHSASLSFESLSVAVMQRPLDMEVSFALTSLSLEDSLRPRNFAAVLLARPEQSSDHKDLISGSYVMVKSPLSPRFEGFQSDLSVRIAGIHAFVDHITTSTYKALTESLMNSFRVMALADSLHSMQSSQAHLADLSGSRFVVSLQQISVHLLAFDSSTRGNADQLECFEIAYSLNICDLSGTCSIQNALSAEGSLRAIEIVDERRKSSDHCYRKMIGGDFHRIAAVSDESKPMISVQLREVINKCLEVDVVMSSVTLLVSAEMITHMVSVLLQNINAFMSVLDVILDCDKPTAQPGYCKQTVVQQSGGTAKPVTLGSCVNITLSMPDPQLMLLDDLKNEHSKALVNRSVVKVEVSVGKAGEEDKVVVYAALTESEIFVVHDVIGFKGFHRLLQPLTLEVRITTSSIQKQMVSIEVGLEVDEVAFRTSLNDLVFLTTIVGGQQFVPEDGVNTSPRISNKTPAPVAQGHQDRTVYRVTTNVSAFEVVLINDYHGQDMPLIRLVASGAGFFAEGVPTQLIGSGEVTITADYFNQHLSLWEPVMEEWQPALYVLHDEHGLHVEASYDRTLQINVTGELIRCMATAGQLMQRIGVQDAPSSVRPALTIANQLGVPFEVLDSAGHSLLMVDGFNVPLPLQLQQSKCADTEDYLTEDYLTLRFHGDLGEQFGDLKHLPHGMRCCKTYQLQPRALAGKQASVQAAPPIVEEVFQHSRYNPLKQKWDEPWLPADPPEWTDAHGQPSQCPDAIHPPAHWKWVEPDWTVDLSKDVDEFGWEYSIDFNLFSGRAKQPADSVRRRRWVRSRKPDAPAKTISMLAAAFVVWEVMMVGETKELRVMTSKQVTNSLPFDVSIGIDEDGHVQETFAVPKGNTISVPLQYSAGACALRLRPSESSCDWSEPLFMTFVHALQDTKVTSKTLLCGGGSQSKHVVWHVEEGLFLCATLLAPLEFCNRLPCAVALTVQSADHRSAKELFDIPAGGDVQALSCDYAGEANVEFCLTVGKHCRVFSISNDIPSTGFKDNNIYLQNAAQSKPLTMTLRTALTALGSMQFTLFSKCLLVDKRFLAGSTVSDVSSCPEYWTEQGCGLSLLDVQSDHVRLLSSDTKTQLEAVDMNTLSQSKCSVELSDEQGLKHHVSLRLQRFPLAPDLSHLLVVMHSFHIVNCMDKSITVRQKAQHSDGSVVMSIPARSCEAWCPLSPSGDTNLHLRCDGCAFSMGCIDINAIGTYTLMLPDYVAVNVEVRFSQEDEPSYITVTVWEAKVIQQSTGAWHTTAAANLLVRNDTSLRMAVRQAGLEACEADGYWAVLRAGETKAFGWADPDLGTVVDIFKDAHRSKPLVSIDTAIVGQEAIFHADDQPWCARIKANSSGTVICLEPIEHHKQSNADRSRCVSFKISLRALGLSLLAEHPTRHELISAHLLDMQATVCHLFPSANEIATTVVQFHVGNVQVDNYSETAVYPVLLHKSHHADKAAEKEGSEKREPVFIEFALTMEQPADQNTAIVKYVAFRILEMQLQLDSASVLIYLCDLHKDLVDVRANMRSEEFSLLLEARDFNEAVAVPVRQSSLYDCDLQYKLSQGKKLFYEHILIHPMKLSVSFYPTHFPRSPADLPAGMKWIALLENISAVEEMDVKIKSFIVRNVMESQSTLANRIVTKVIRDMQSNLLGLAGNLIGSLSILGKPAGLYKNIGSGVQDFFYEPLSGLMESPLSFARGLTKGTGSLISGVAGGVVSSTAGILGSATGSASSMARGMAVRLTGDEEFLAKHDESKRSLKSSGKGILSGMKAGGETVGTGLFSGLAGLVNRPAEECRKGGALGLFKGIGQGLAGAAIKPILGVTQGISNLSVGIGNQLSDSIEHRQLRPPRALLKRSPDDADMVLFPLDLFAAQAQALVGHRAKKNEEQDAFYAAVHLGFSEEGLEESNAFAIVLSAKHLLLMGKLCQLLWSFDLPRLSHVSLGKVDEQYYLDIHEYAQMTASELKHIRCADKHAAMSAYRRLHRFRSIFGNPSAMLSPSEAMKRLQCLLPSDSPVSDDSSSDAAEPCAAIAQAANVVEYRFGLANTSTPPREHVSDQQLLAKTMEHLLQLPCRLPVTSSQDKFAYHKALDQAVWTLVCAWQANHRLAFNGSRCCACLVLNYSNTPVQVQQVELIEGSGTVIMPVGSGYDANAQIIFAGGGAAVFFAYSSGTLLKGHVLVKIQTSAFCALISSKEGSDCSAEAGFSPCFLEKTRTGCWGKFVISVA